VLPLIFFWNQETGSPPYYIKRRGIHLKWGSRAKRKEKAKEGLAHTGTLP
jgi:hypothetical protein